MIKMIIFDHFLSQNGHFLLQNGHFLLQNDENLSYLKNILSLGLSIDNVAFKINNFMNYSG